MFHGRYFLFQDSAEKDMWLSGFGGKVSTLAAVLMLAQMVRMAWDPLLEGTFCEQSRQAHGASLGITWIGLFYI